MIQQFDQIQKFGQDNLDAAMKTFGAVSKGAQAIAVETADYAKKSFEQTTSTIEKLVGAQDARQGHRDPDRLPEERLRGLRRQSTKIGELYQAVAKEAFKPLREVSSPKSRPRLSKPETQSGRFADARPRAGRFALGMTAAAAAQDGARRDHWCKRWGRFTLSRRACDPHLVDLANRGATIHYLGDAAGDDAGGQSGPWQQRGSIGHHAADGSGDLAAVGGRLAVSVRAGQPRRGRRRRQRTGTAIITKTKPRTKRPNLYRVLS